jgi:hypothetical protein
MDRQQLLHDSSANSPVRSAFALNSAMFLACSQSVFALVLNLTQQTPDSRGDVFSEHGVNDLGN